MSKLSSSFKNLSKLIEARLHAELSRCIYSLHGLEALIRPALGVVCQRLIVLSNWRPESAHSHEASAICRQRLRALIVSKVFLVVTALRSLSSSFSTARIKASVTRTELLAFWYWTEKLSLPSRSIS